MNCKKVKRQLPLFLGSELSDKRSSAIKSHLKECPQCHREYESYVFTMQKMKEWFDKESQEWKENEWQQVVREAVVRKKGLSGSTVFAPWPFKRRWAYALMLGAAFILSIIIIRPAFLKNKFGFKAPLISQNHLQSERASEFLTSQETISMILVSGETGLKINWFFNKNFQWEDKK